MYLVLCSSNDVSAKWAYEFLKKRRVRPLELVTSEELAYCRVWEHRVGLNTPSLRLALADGRLIDSQDVQGVLNRLVSAPTDLVNFAQTCDREYAVQELTSFYLSWLQSLPGVVINRPEPQGLCGRWRHTSEWAALAQGAGLPAPPYRQRASDNPMRGYGSLAPANARTQAALILQGKVVGAKLPQDTASACIRFAELADLGLMGLTLFLDSNGIWNFGSATPYPDFTGGGEELIDHLAAVLTRKCGASTGAIQ
jgi:hypothetical protein